MSKRAREETDPLVHSGDTFTTKDSLMLQSGIQFAEVSKDLESNQKMRSSADWSDASDDQSGDESSGRSPPHALTTTIIQSPGFKNEKSSMFLEAFMEKGADVNARDSQDWTPLHVAAYYGQEDVCEVLAKVQGIDLEARNTHGDTPLHMAAKWPHDKATERLCRVGANPNSRNNKGRTPLHTAALFTRRTVLEKLIASGGDINAMDNEKATPLHLAVRPNNPIEMDLVMLIIRSGAKLDAEDAKGRRPMDSLPRPQSLIHFAASEGQVDLMSQLLSSKGGCKVDEVNNDGLTPLQIASMKGDVETVKLLLQHGARPNIPAGKGKDGAGAGSSKTSAKQVQIGDRAAIHFAAEKGHGNVVTVLVAAGAKVNQPSECGMTALHLAVWHRQIDAIRALLQAKADVHARVKTNGMTPLHYAAFNSHGNRDIVSILLDKGSELEARTQEGWTPLHLASTTGPIEVVYELLLRGARVPAKGRRGQTAIECAKRRPEVILLLNAAVNAPGGGGGRRVVLPPLPPPQVSSNPSSGKYALPPPPLAGIPDPIAQLSDSNSTPPPTSLVDAGPEAPLPSSAPSSAALQPSSSSGKVAKTARAPPALPHGLSWDNPPPPNNGSGAFNPTSLPALLPPAKPPPPAKAPPPAIPIVKSEAVATSEGGSSVTVLQGRDTPALTNLIATLQAYQNMGMDPEPLPPELAALTPAAIIKMGASGPLASHLMSMIQEPRGTSSAMIGPLKANVMTLPSASTASTSLQSYSSLGACSLQPGWIFGDCKCQDTFTVSNTKAAEVDKVMLHIFCNHACTFHFHPVCWKVAKDKIRSLFPNFNGFSSNLVTVLPCLSNHCTGLIDEVFMGDSKTGKEIYRLQSGVMHTNPNALASRNDPHDSFSTKIAANMEAARNCLSASLAAASLEASGIPTSDDSAKPWQDLLQRGDKLLKELQTQEQILVDASAVKSDDQGLQGSQKQKTKKQEEPVSAKETKASEGSTSNASGGFVKSAKKLMPSISAHLRSIAAGPPPKAYAPPPPCDPLPDTPDDVSLDEEAPHTSSPSPKDVAPKKVMAAASKPSPPPPAGKKGAKQGGKQGGGVGGAGGAEDDLPDWLLEEIKQEEQVAAAKEAKKAKQAAAAQQQQATAAAAAAASAAAAVTVAKSPKSQAPVAPSAPATLLSRNAPEDEDNDKEEGGGRFLNKSAFAALMINEGGSKEATKANLPPPALTPTPAPAPAPAAKPHVEEPLPSASDCKAAGAAALAASAPSKKEKKKKANAVVAPSIPVQTSVPGALPPPLPPQQQAPGNTKKVPEAPHSSSRQAPAQPAYMPQKPIAPQKPSPPPVAVHQRPSDQVVAPPLAQAQFSPHVSTMPPGYPLNPSQQLQGPIQQQPYLSRPQQPGITHGQYAPPMQSQAPLQHHQAPNNWISMHEVETRLLNQANVNPQGSIPMHQPPPAPLLGPTQPSHLQHHVHLSGHVSPIISMAPQHAQQQQLELVRQEQQRQESLFLPSELFSDDVDDSSNRHLLGGNARQDNINESAMRRTAAAAASAWQVSPPHQTHLQQQQQIVLPSSIEAALPDELTLDLGFDSLGISSLSGGMLGGTGGDDWSGGLYGSSQPPPPPPPPMGLGGLQQRGSSSSLFVPTQQQQQQGNAQGSMSGGDVIAGALSELKMSMGQNHRGLSSPSSRHLLIECPDITLMAKTPAMVEAWMREHVGRYGSIEKWRILGPCGSLVITMDSSGSCTAAAQQLSGTTMIMRPVGISLLSDFPDNDRLAGEAQKVAMRRYGSGSAYMACMSSCWQLLQDLPAPTQAAAAVGW